MSIGVGLVTHRRPAYYAAAAASIVYQVAHLCSAMGAVHDGPDPGDYPAVPGMPLTFLPANVGVGAAKNVLIRSMLDAGCEWIFLAEDDVTVESPLAVLGFVEACVESGWEHLGWPFHGSNDPVDAGPVISTWFAMSGAWTITSRHAFEVAGIFDEGFVNCHEHFELTLRMAELGLTTGWREFAAPTGCEGWLSEQPSAIESSTIRTDPEWPVKISRAWDHWRSAHPTTYAMARGSRPGP